ncbi:MAG: hypothetical protein JSS67_02470 [Bacteroidetes bacterium]|nr:hypothetical protein [Bacteroidota bacterium]
MKKFFLIILLFSQSFLWLSCAKQSETLPLPALTDYYPLAVGHTLVYRLDSTSLTSFGQALEVHSYHLKDSIGDTVMDNQGRLSYRVFRSITDTMEQTGWVPLSTYYITPTPNSIEVVDDHNLRFIKLVEPLREGFSWKGNSYIDTRSANSPVQYMDNWNYVYQNNNQIFNSLMGPVDYSVTVFQQDETSPEGPFNPLYYQQRNYSVEVYAKGIGLIYKDFLHWTWQTTPPPASFADDSYGFKINLLRVEH